MSFESKLIREIVAVNTVMKIAIYWATHKTMSLNWPSATNFKRTSKSENFRTLWHFDNRVKRNRFAHCTCNQALSKSKFYITYRSSVIFDHLDLQNQAHFRILFLGGWGGRGGDYHIIQNKRKYQTWTSGDVLHTMQLFRVKY